MKINLKYHFFQSYNNKYETLKSYFTSFKNFLLLFFILFNKKKSITYVKLK